jgi:hypothetical protein
VALALTVTAVTLASLLVRAQQPEPSHATELYNEWTFRMASMLTPFAAPPVTVLVQSFSVPNAYARGLVQGYSVQRQPLPHDQALLTSYLVTINQYLDRLIQDSWADPKSVRRADLLRLSRLVRTTLFARLPAQRTSRGGP